MQIKMMWCYTWVTVQLELRSVLGIFVDNCTEFQWFHLAVVCTFAPRTVPLPFWHHHPYRLSYRANYLRRLQFSFYVISLNFFSRKIDAIETLKSPSRTECVSSNDSTVDTDTIRHVYRTQSHSFNLLRFFFFSFYQLNCSYLLRFERVTVIKPTLLYFTRIIHSENVIFNESSNGI